ncbi:SDR family NAD(P)-dependent oxidoreductase [Sulfuracidifex tepidarius]|uniref:L-rhamnose 1-dehydrogenase n=1 Tax=Sulfuracidifex tepidarius TaxID=1294262 RepID=A0A510DZ48_9CREN|nr:SDR family NAD(P)-dependent oxidoreductase [Sulfuracidifex tepidarius]BBG22737.1 hypothetical protein IC006_0021 [Sulfuracidifex tepidarius]BBG25516.1 hypothetical protein IC007_0021 [Sulfuracidifex tepidarius]
MDQLLSGRKVGIIGVSEGLGYALAYFLLKDGAKVLINARNKEKLDKIESSLRKYGTIESFDASMENLENVDRLFNFAKEKLGGLDDLVVAIGGYIEDDIADPKGLDAMIDSQVKLQLRVISKSLNYLHSGSTIVMISSMRGIDKGLSNQLSYGVAKAAVAKSVQILASFLLEKGIRVVGIAPSVIDGKFEPEREWRKLRKLGEWKAPPEDFASVISILLSDRMEWVNGVVIPVDGGAFLK